VSAEATGLNRSVPLPSGLKHSHIQQAIEYIENETAEFVDVYYEQANVFSAQVGIFGIRALHVYSPYKRHKHPDIAQQRFPDRSLDGKRNPPPRQALESKGTTRPWALQSHYNHAGWYVVWRYIIDPTKQVKRGRQVVIWRVDIRFLQKEDWKYEGSKAGEGQGGRTHAFGVNHPASRFRDSAVYLHPAIVLRRGKPT
jgi:hypothetical protein